MALQNPIPPPPYIDLGRQKRVHLWRAERGTNVQSPYDLVYSAGISDTPQEHTWSMFSISGTRKKDLSRSSGGNFLLLCLIFMQTRRRIRRMLSSCQRFWLASSSHRIRPNAQSPAMNMSEQTAPYSTSVPSHSTTGLRRRKGHGPNSTI